MHRDGRVRAGAAAAAVVALALVQVGLLARDRLLVEAAARAGARAAAVEADEGGSATSPRGRARPRSGRAHLSSSRAGSRGDPVTVTVDYAEPVRVPFIGWLFGDTVSMEHQCDRPSGVRVVNTRGERGSVSIVVVALMAVALALSMGAADLARVLTGAARAQTAADAAALAAAQELAVGSSGSAPGDLAAEYAGRNDAVLTSCTCDAGGTEAVVTVDRCRLARCCWRPTTGS